VVPAHQAFAGPLDVQQRDAGSSPGQRLLPGGNLPARRCPGVRRQVGGERVACFLDGDELPVGQATGVALAQRHDQLELPGIQDIGDLASHRLGTICSQHGE
jgi:hypothetical protein